MPQKYVDGLEGAYTLEECLHKKVLVVTLDKVVPDRACCTRIKSFSPGRLWVELGSYSGDFDCRDLGWFLINEVKILSLLEVEIEPKA